MKDARKTKKQLMDELDESRKNIDRLQSIISELRLNEDNHQEFERRYSLHFSLSNDVMYSYDKQFRFLSVSSNVKKVLGYKPEEMIGRSFIELGILDPDELERAESEAVKILTGDSFHCATYRFITKSGRKGFGEVSCVPLIDDGEVTGVISVARDVTDRMQAEELLRKSEEKYRLITDNISDIVLTCDLEGSYTYVSPSHGRVLGRGDEVIGRSVFEHIHPDDLKMAQYIFFMAAMNRTIGRAEYRYLHPLRGYIWLESQGRVADNEKLTGIIMSRDITDRKQVEEAIRDSEEKYSLLIENANEAICVEQDGMICFINPKFIDISGYSEEEVTSRPYIDYIQPEDRMGVLDWHKRRLLGENVTGNHVFRAIDKHGCIRWVEANAVRIDWEGRPATLNFLTDITQRMKTEEERKKLENQLIQAQKLEALGRFAGGIAHDLNNMLYPMIINIELLLKESRSDPETGSLLQEVLNAVYRQRDMVKQILSFSRRNEQKLVPVRVGPLVKEILNFIRSSLPSTISLEQNINPGSDVIMGNATQIQQVVLNLCRNAADALELQKGTIEVTLTDTQDTGMLDKDRLKDNKYIRLMVRDTGCGMTADVRDKIFEPFFTTKDIGKGSGMGLAMVHGIVKDHHGDVTVESEPGKGTLFTVYFPLCKKEFRPKAVPSSLRPISPDDRNENILLIDDEEIILSSLQRVLNLSGYCVTAVKDGEEALRLFGDAPDAFDLVITDLTMPRMTGIELTRQLLNIRPGIPIILCTGFNDAVNRQEVRSLGIRELLLKPAGTRELRETVRKALEQ